MLSLRHCRTILGPKTAISDENLATLRDQLYCLAALALDNRDKTKRTSSTFRRTEGDAISNEGLEILRERAAIIEFDGNISRDEAERMAITLSGANDLEN
jgi:hypothetical protein